MLGRTVLRELQPLAGAVPIKSTGHEWEQETRSLCMPARRASKEGSLEEPAKALALLCGLGLFLRGQPRRFPLGVRLKGGVDADGGLQVLAGRCVLPHQCQGRSSAEQRLGTCWVHPVAVEGRKMEGARQGVGV